MSRAEFEKAYRAITGMQCDFTIGRDYEDENLSIAYRVWQAALASREGEPEQENEPDNERKESDGCPNELAVLQRFWRDRQRAEREGEAVVYQSRIHPSWNPELYSEWVECTKEQFDEYRKSPIVNEWETETRALYTHPQAAVPECLQEFLNDPDAIEGCLEWVKCEDQTVNVGDVTGEGEEHVESSAGWITRLLTALLTTHKERTASMEGT